MTRSARPIALVSLLVAACDGSDGGLKVYNSNPTPVITWPTDGEVVPSGEPVTLTGRGEDSETPAAELISEWQVDGVAVCEDVALASDGGTSCATTLEPGSHTITLVVVDTSGGISTETVSVIAESTGAPIAEITEPSGGFHYSDQDILFAGQVSDGEDAPTALTVAWSSSLDGPLTVDDSADGAGTLSGAARLSQGVHTITLSATDSTGLTGSDELVIEVLGPNNPPDCGITAPASGSSDDVGVMVDFVGEATDPDVPAETLLVQWSSDLDGTLWAGNAGADGSTTLSTDALVLGTHRITLTVTDDRGVVCVDDIIYTVGSPPTVSIDQPFDGDLVNEGELVEFLGTIADEQSLPGMLDVRWVSDIDGVLDTTPSADMGVAEGDAAQVGFDTSGLSAGTHTITLQATDGDGMYGEDSIAFQVNDLPSAPTILITPPVPTTVDDLTINITADSTDLEGHPISYAYEWFLNGVPAGITATVVPNAATSRGDVWSVNVTPFDGYGSGDVATASVTIANTPPVVDGAPSLTPLTVYEGDTFTCSLVGTSDLDGDPTTSSVQWYVNGLLQAASGTTLGSSFYGSGDSVYCVQVPNDGAISGTGVPSNTVVVSNTAPSVASVIITPDPGRAADTLTCSWTFSDVDGDADASTVEWFVNGVSTGTGRTLSGAFVHQDVVTCTVTPNDGAATGTPGSDSLIVSNTAPVLSSAAVTPNPATTTDLMTCTPGSAVDADGESISYTYSWYVNGVYTGTGSTLSASASSRGQSVWCTVTPTDGTTAGATVTSNTVVISNTAPVVSSVTLSPSSPRTAETITATPVTSDVDGDSVSVSYAWYVNGVFAVTNTTGTLSGLVYFDRGDTVYVVATPSDGTASGAASTSATVTVVNTLPTAPTLSFTPTSPGAGVDPIRCNIATPSTDADGDSISYTFSWTVDGYDYPGSFSGVAGPATTAYTDDTVPAADSDLGFDWVCTVTPNDGYGDGADGLGLVTVLDVTDPDAPVLDTPTRYRNTDDLTLTGECDSSDCVTVVAECINATDGFFSASGTCTSADEFEISFAGLARGVTTTCFAHCVDAAGNESGDSNTTNTEVCAVEDVYEDGSYGNASAAAIDEWSALGESTTNFELVQANILETDTVDWYVFSGADVQATNISAGYNYYAMDFRLTDPATGVASTDYVMQVYKGNDASSSLECSTTSGYTKYTDYVYDRGDHVHSVPADNRRCAMSSASLNNCEDFTKDYYVKVTRVSPTVTSCAAYQLRATNAAGVCNTTTECPN
jgi:hypothetical protein